MAHNAFLSTKFDSQTRYSERVVVRALQTEQRCNPPKPNIKQRSSLSSLHASPVFYEIVLKQVWYTRFWTDTFTDAALVHYGTTSIDYRIPKRLVSFRKEGSLTWEGGLNVAKLFDRILRW